MKMVKFCKSAKCLVGKTAIVTGGNTGIGFETALEFATRGCRVILACRNQKKATEACDKIIKLTANNNVIVKLLDLESLQSVRDFVKDINTTEDRLDILVNNAGAGYLQEKITADGLQLGMAVNYFSPFLLTNLLLDLLKKSAPSRIINLSSQYAMFACPLDLDDLNGFPGHSQMYAKTKQCNIYFTVELAKKLEGTGVTTYSLHPGTVHTEFQRYSNILNFFAKKFYMTPKEGAQTSIYLALQDDIEKYNGRHFYDSTPVNPYTNINDMEKAKKLWELSEEMVGLK